MKTHPCLVRTVDHAAELMVGQPLEAICRVLAPCHIPTHVFGARVEWGNGEKEPLDPLRDLGDDLLDQVVADRPGQAVRSVGFVQAGQHPNGHRPALCGAPDGAGPLTRLFVEKYRYFIPRETE